jgi:DNA processing protein
MMDNELCGLMALSRIPGIGNVLLKQLISYTGSADSALSASSGSLAKIPGIGPFFARAVVEHRAGKLAEAMAEIERAGKENARLLHYLQPEYPSRLKKIPDAPPVIYLKGNFSFENPRILAIVGTRQASNYGKLAIESFISDLKPYKPVIVSGLAYGIDAHAHKMAIQEGIETWAVLGTSINFIYPSPHKGLAAKVQACGGIISEVPLDGKQDPSNFPERNRIIAGLSDAVWVVEAGEKGGALITARLALDYFRDVFALPGDFRSPVSAGCHHLIASGSAGLVTSASTLAEAAGWKLPASGEASEMEPLSQTPSGISDPEEEAVYRMLGRTEIHLDELSWQSGLSVNKLAGILLGLEFAGFVKSLPGKRYARR